MPAQLVSLVDGPNILLDKPILLFGRHVECDVQLQSRKVSRLHCCVAQVTDYLVVRDLGSTNGVRINGEKVVEGKLGDGDELTIGNFRYQVRTGAPSAVGETVAAPDDDAQLEQAEKPVPIKQARESQILPARKAGPRMPIQTSSVVDLDPYAFFGEDFDPGAESLPDGPPKTK